MKWTKERERYVRGLAHAADQQPWRCVNCGEAVSHINPRPCRCTKDTERAPTDAERAD